MSDSTPKMCENCTTGGILAGEPKGTMIELGGLDCYLAEGKSTEKAIVLGTDFFGLGIPNPKLLADHISSTTGFPVYVPDFLEGVYPPQDRLAMIEEPIADKWLFTKVYLKAKFIASFLFSVGPGFLKRLDFDAALPKAEKVIDELRAVKGYQRVGWVGYCWGATVGTYLMPSPDAIDVYVSAHPAANSIEKFKALTKPFALILPQEDGQFDGVKDKALKMLAERKAEGIPFELYQHGSDTVHGFAARPNVKLPGVKEAFDLSLKQTTDWFEKYL
ncbi:hypothetical protein BCR35DRAFT_15925 [Leucosporidium creatinivorum]|uniref:Dienelactone hydrolase domain-containing protein n=1 Tax=Leucosporidium creatinivorum TaxID=106004 RepID=A0A1Y2FX14_9BASI|nr:hypothetical protein BCR35DRAFT_15925 [Leucosporidium creatinivorum]